MKNNLDNIDGIERAAIRNSRNGEPFVLRGRKYRLIPDPEGVNLRRYLCLRRAQRIRVGSLRILPLHE